MQRSSINALLFAVKHWETKKFSCKKLLIKLRPSQSIQKPHNAYSLWTERKKTWCDLLIPSWEQAFPLIWNMCNMHIRPVHSGILSRLYANLKEEKPLIQKFVFNPIGWKFRPSHCWQQGWVQKNSCLLSWASSKYVREGERNERDKVFRVRRECWVCGWRTKWSLTRALMPTMCNTTTTTMMAPTTTTTSSLNKE